MQKAADAADISVLDISVLFFSAGANLWAILGHFWAISGQFGQFWVIFGPFFGANFLWQNMHLLCYLNRFLQLCGEHVCAKSAVGIGLVKR